MGPVWVCTAVQLACAPAPLSALPAYTLRGAGGAVGREVVGHCVPSWNTVQCGRCFPAVLHCAALQGIALQGDRACFVPTMPLCAGLAARIQCHCDRPVASGQRAPAAVGRSRHARQSAGAGFIACGAQHSVCHSHCCGWSSPPSGFPRVQVRAVIFTSTDGNVRNGRQRCLRLGWGCPFASLPPAVGNCRSATCRLGIQKMWQPVNMSPRTATLRCER